jgi:hypothetical protein
MHRHGVAVTLLLVLPGCVSPGQSRSEGTTARNGDCSHHLARAQAELNAPADSTGAATAAAHHAHAAAMHEYHRCLSR